LQENHPKLKSLKIGVENHPLPNKNPNRIIENGEN